MEEPTKTPMTPEEAEAKKAQILVFYEKEIPFLTKRKEYEQLLTELEELDLRRAFVHVKLAEIYGPAPEETSKKEPSVRQLKKEPA